MATKPTHELMHEHQAIKRMLRVLGAISERLEAGEKVDPDDLESIVDFIRVFADSCHHGKEEDLLFVEMRKAGVPGEGGPIMVMEQEHDLGRSFVAGLAEAVARYRAGDADAARDIIENARDYIALLSQHIDKEDAILYPLADDRLSEEQQTRLAAGFEKVESERIGPGKHEEFHQLLERLEKSYLA